jgi:hypothetical protein
MLTSSQKPLTSTLTKLTTTAPIAPHARARKTSVPAAIPLTPSTASA